MAELRVDSNRWRVLQAIDSGARTEAQAATATGLTRARVRTALNNLRYRGLAHRKNNALRATDEGRASLRAAA